MTLGTGTSDGSLMTMLASLIKHAHEWLFTSYDVLVQMSKYLTRYDKGHKCERNRNFAPEANPPFPPHKTTTTTTTTKQENVNLHMNLNTLCVCNKPYNLIHRWWSYKTTWLCSYWNGYCPACRTTLVATRFRVAVICPIIQVPHCIRVFFYFVWFVFINQIFNFIMNYVPIVTFWIFTYHKIWILSIMFCFIWSYWIIYFLACLEVSWRVVS